MSTTESLLRHLAAYLPVDRLHALAAGDPLPSRRARGVALLADISGFTPVSEALERDLGPRRGGEELTRHLNAAYAALIEEIHAYHGSVVGFAGDAVLCWFAGERAARAAACGLRLQEVMAGLGAIVTPSAAGGESPPREGMRLGLKVAVCAGEARRDVVGEPTLQRLDILSGHVVDRVARAEGAAGRGDVVVDAVVKEAVEALGASRLEARAGGPGEEALFVLREWTGREGPEPWSSPELARLTPSALEPWLLPAVYQRLSLGLGDLLAELRQAVAIFVRFSGIDFERDPDAAERLDAYVRWTQGVADRYGASLIQLTTGDKGSYLYVAVGAPVAHEDAVERALPLALALRAPPPSLGFIETVQIGVSTGRMRTGAYGSLARRTYGVLGDETNVAARLMMFASPGQIVMTERVAAAAASYEVRPLGEVSLKGKSAPRPVFELVGRLGRASTRPAAGVALLGRTAERGALRRAVAAARGEAPARAIVFEGEAGIGKSRLVAEALELAAGGAVRALVGAGDPIEHATPYFAWRPVFAALFDLGEGVEPAVAAARVMDRLGPEERPLAALLGSVLDVELPESTTSDQLRGSLRAARIPGYLARVFCRLRGPSAAGGTLLVLEDAHWFDSSSWALLEAVLAAGRALAVVVTTRPHGRPAPRGAEVLPLGPLSADDAAALVARTLGVREAPAEVAALIQSKAEGNPFFTEELASALRESGALRIDAGRCTVVEPLDALQCPDTIEGVVTSRIDRLTPSSQLALKVASVVGRVFELATLRDVVPVPAERAELPRVLEALERLDITARLGPETWAFKHAVTLEVAYGRMLFEQRRELHAAVADWIERVHAGDLAPHVPLLAHHRARAIEGVLRPDEGSVRLAVSALGSAGAQSIERGATPEAIAHLELGLRLLEALPPGRERDRAELELRSSLGAALVVARGATHPAARAEFGRARELCESLGESGRLFEAVFGLFYSCLTGSDREGAEELAARLLSIARGTGRPAERSLAHQACGAAAVCAGRHEEGLAHMRQAIALAASGPGSGGALSFARDPLVMAHCYCAWASWFSGSPDTAVAEVERGVVLAQDVSHPLTLTQALSFGALVRRYRREIAEAEALTARAHALAREHGFPYWLGVTSSLLGWIALERGDLEAAVAHLRGGMARGREAGVVPVATIIALADLIAALTRLGRFEDARAACEEGKEMSATRLLGFGEPEIHRAEAELWIARGDAPRAEAAFARALEVATAQGAASLALRAASGLARVARSALPLSRLAALYATFTEGHSTLDLREAAALLGARVAARPSALEVR